MVRTAKDWPWSSYKSTAGFTQLPPALTTDWILGNFGKQRKKAQDGYKAFVREGKNQPSPWEYLKNQIYLGSDKFVEDMQCKLDPDQSLEGIPKPQKMSPPKPLRYYEKSTYNVMKQWQLAIEVATIPYSRWVSILVKAQQR